MKLTSTFMLRGSLTRREASCSPYSTQDAAFGRGLHCWRCRAVTTAKAHRRPNPFPKSASPPSHPHDPPRGRNGRVEAVDAVELRPRVSGYLQRVAYKEGAWSRRARCCSRSTRARTGSRSIAPMRSCSVRPRASRTMQLKRVQTLIDAHATSQEELDNARATAEQARADLQAADAAVADAKLNLGFTEVRAPIAGRVGRAVATVGNLARGRHAADDRRVAEPRLRVFRLRRTELPALQRAARRSETSRDRRRSGARGPRERDGLPMRAPSTSRQPARPANGHDPRARAAAE